MTDLTTAWMLGCVSGFFLGVTVASRRRQTCRELMRDPARQPTFAELLMPRPRDRDPDWRRSFSHENTNHPSGPPPLRFDEGRVQRSHANAEPTTPKPVIMEKPQPSGGRISDPWRWPGSYQPRRTGNGTPNDPPRKP